MPHVLQPRELDYMVCDRGTAHWQAFQDAGRFAIVVVKEPQRVIAGG